MEKEETTGPPAKSVTGRISWRRWGEEEEEKVNQLFRKNPYLIFFLCCKVTITRCSRKLVFAYLVNFMLVFNFQMFHAVLKRENRAKFYRAHCNEFFLPHLRQLIRPVTDFAGGPVGETLNPLIIQTGQACNNNNVRKKRKVVIVEEPDRTVLFYYYLPSYVTTTG